MTRFVQLAAYKTKSLRIGHTRELTAKLVGNRIVFAGSHIGQHSINADADIGRINISWKVYCAASDGSSLFGLVLIERADIDAARGK